VSKVIFRYRDDTEHELEVEDGNTLMYAAFFEGLPGIEGICGGVAACGTCHVLVDEAWRAACGTPDRAEEARLAQLASRQAASRLACQITVSPQLDGLVVIVAAE
jgi:2Fe-2S ferredoxin